MKHYTLNGSPAVANSYDLPADGMIDGVEVIDRARLGREFRRICDETGLKLGALAGILGVTPKTLSNYSSGKTAPPPTVWREVAARRLK